MLDPSSMGGETQLGFALVTNRGDASNHFRPQFLKESKSWCDCYHKPYHTKKTYWHLHGKPVDWKPKSQRKQHATTHVVESTLNQK